MSVLPETFERRVTRLEARVDLLEQLPDRVTAVETQIVQLREETRAEFSAVRSEMRELNAKTIQVVEMLNAETKRRIDVSIARMDALYAQADRKMEALHGQTDRKMEALHAQTDRKMEALHGHLLKLDKQFIRFHKGVDKRHREILSHLGRIEERRSSAKRPKQSR
jgi:hypothetical protein